MSIVQGAFPRSLALAASWDPWLVREVNARVAGEVRARGGRMVMGPVLDVTRDPRRGRLEDTFGEDPYLVGEMGVAAVEGLQGKGSARALAPGRVLAAVGHLAGPGLPNDASGVGAAPVSERELREVFFPPFEEVIARTAAAVIVASRNAIDGMPIHANRWLLRDVLRGEWKYAGAVIASPGGIGELHTVYHVAASAADAARLARVAGLDADVTQVKDARTPAHTHAADARTRAIALDAARRSITLLKNDGALPLAARTKVALIELGETGLAGLRETVLSKAEIVSRPEKAERIVVALGDSGAAERRGLFDSLVPLGKPIIVLLASARPQVDAETAGNANALVAAWSLGAQGASAVADVLFGVVNPGGKLPITIARGAGQLPLFYDAKPSARRGYLFDTSEPLFAFGWGLGYSTFELGAPRLSSATMARDGSVRVEVDVRNSGARAGDETVQLYIRDKVSSVTRPVRELKGFRRVSLAAGEKRTVTFTLTAWSLAIWDERMQRAVEPGEFEVMTGPDSVNLRSTTLTVLE